MSRWFRLGWYLSMHSVRSTAVYCMFADECHFTLPLTGSVPVYRCVSFRTPENVRKEWASEHGLPLFASDTYTHAMDAVCQRLGVSEGTVLAQPAILQGFSLH